MDSGPWKTCGHSLIRRRPDRGTVGLVRLNYKRSLIWETLLFVDIIPFYVLHI